MSVTRRSFVTGMAAAGLTGFAASAHAAGFGGAALAMDYGVDPGSSADQTAAIQGALDRAAREGRGLFLPGGTYSISTIELPEASALGGLEGATRLVGLRDGPIVVGENLMATTLEGLEIDGNGVGPESGRAGLVTFTGCARIDIDRVSIGNTRGTALYLSQCGGSVAGCRLHGAGSSGLFSTDAQGLRISGNTIKDCGNGGVRIWRSQTGPDGTIVTGNRISQIRTEAGGSGQNGNGVNVYRAGEVTIADNHITDCAFSAIRVNGAHDNLIRGNTCRSLGEVAIFSEFDFSGSVIADNVVDTAAAGISMTNFDHDGRLATCSGNIVRNILAASPTNPDTSPYGIGAQADASVTGNVVESVPGRGISAGWGPFLRDVSISANVVRNARIGIAVSVADGAGAASVTGNLVGGSQIAAIAGMRWSDIAEADLQANAGRFPQLNVAGNLIR